MTPTPKHRLVVAIGLLTALWTQSALGHVLQGEAYGFVTGFLHPISGADHVLAMVAVGLWGAQLGAPAIWVLPVAFPLVMAMGGMNERAFQALNAAEGFQVGAGPSVVVMDEGKARSVTTATLTSDVYAFVFAQQGLMGGVGLEGTKITKLKR